MALTPVQWVALGAGLYAGIGIPLALVWWYRRRYRSHSRLPTQPDDLDTELLDQTMPATPSLHRATPYSSAAQSLGQSHPQFLSQSNNRGASQSSSEPSTASFTAPTVSTRESIGNAHTDWPQAFRESRVISGGRPPNSSQHSRNSGSQVAAHRYSQNSLGPHSCHTRDGSRTAADRSGSSTKRTSRPGSGPSDKYWTPDHHSKNSHSDSSALATSILSADGRRALEGTGAASYISHRNDCSTPEERASRHSFAPGDRTAPDVPPQRGSYASGSAPYAQSWRYPHNWPVAEKPARSPDPSTGRPSSAALGTAAGPSSPPLSMPVPMPASPPSTARPPPPDPTPHNSAPEEHEPARPPSELRDELKRQLEVPHTPAPPKSPGAVTILKDVLFSEPEQIDAPGPSRERVIVRNEEDAETVRLELLPPQYRAEWGEAHALAEGEKADAGERRA